MPLQRLANEHGNMGYSFPVTPSVVHLPTVQHSQSDWLGKAAADHIQEWRDSGVDLGIITLNVETLTDTATSDYADSLFPIAERLNWKITRFGQRPRSNLRGWWVSGIDPLNNWERMQWGRFGLILAEENFWSLVKFQS